MNPYEFRGVMNRYELGSYLIIGQLIGISNPRNLKYQPTYKRISHIMNII